MKRSLRITSSLVLIMLLLIILGCSAIPLGIQNLIHTQTPTPTATPTTTSTPTSTPLPPVSISACSDDGSCASIVSVYDYLEGSIAYGNANVIEIPYNQPVFISDRWYAMNEELYTENADHVRWFFKIDGQDFFQENWLEEKEIYAIVEDENFYPGQQWGVVLEGWKIGESHRIELGYVIDQDISTGWVDYHEGYLYQVTLEIIPVELPTATPTATETSTPTATSTRIPYTSTPKPTALPACNVNSTIDINNTTGSWMTLKLKGPASFRFDLAPGKTVLKVCSGSYTYEAWGCGGAYDSGKIKSNEAHKFYCN